MDDSVDLECLKNIIEGKYGCDNCEHSVDGTALRYCKYCKPGFAPSMYCPRRHSIYEKCWYDDWDKVSYNEFVLACGF